MEERLNSYELIIHATAELAESITDTLLTTPPTSEAERRDFCNHDFHVVRAALQLIAASTGLISCDLVNDEIKLS